MCRNVRLWLIGLAIGLAAGAGCEPSNPEPADAGVAAGRGAPAGTTNTNGTTAPIAPGRGPQENTPDAAPGAGELLVDSDEPRAARPRRRLTGSEVSVPLVSPLTADSSAGGSARDARDREEDQDDPDAPVLPPAAEDDRPETPKFNNGRSPGAKPGVPGSWERPQSDPAGTGEPAGPPAVPVGDEDPPVTGRAPNGSADTGRAESDTDRAGTPPAAGQPQDVLPDKYRALDKDGDGQLGLYEWPRDDLDAFRKLDRDQDGFLVPGELAD